MVKFNYIDLFSGIGGFALGLKQAGIEFENHWFSEIDKHAINIYKKHFPNAKELGNVKTIRDVSDLKADLITFGFPCQDLSIAGKRRGLEGTRSGLFFEAIRLVRQLRPRYFIFENVKGLLTNNRGQDFVRCLRKIADLGFYACEWQLVNTVWFLPQNRERLYFVGHFGGNSGQQIFPLESSNSATDEIQRQYTNTITARYNQAGNQGSFIIENKQHTSVQQNNIVCPVISTRFVNKKQNGRVFKENGEPSFTLTACDNPGLYDGQAIRRLTPLECERLQGFPDGWTEYGTDGKKISDTARYKALGNAVSVPIPQYIGTKILEIERKTNK